MGTKTVKLFDSELKVMDVLGKKGAIERSEPNFMCHAPIPKEAMQEAYAAGWNSGLPSPSAMHMQSNGPPNDH